MTIVEPPNACRLVASSVCTAGVLIVLLLGALIVDTTFNPGDDIDGDGDTDVFDPLLEGTETCDDVDGDGDIEFPAGFYAAGTILEHQAERQVTEFRRGLRVTGLLTGS